jgi:asparagine synthase (glutamine-hydrolysing)
MCGFVGLFDSRGKREVDRHLVQSMNESLVHRGPDGEGYHFDYGIGLGHRRLAVIDLATGQQPIYNEDGTIAVVYNGEIYNYRDLRRALQALGHSFRSDSDTEVIVHAWEEWGEDCLQRFSGMFAFALWDSGQETLFLARDRLGKKPLYYAILEDGWLIFGSELKSLLPHPMLRRVIDPHAVEDFFTFGYVPDPRSIFAGVSKLAPANRLTWQRGGQPKVQAYWQLSFDERLVAAPEDIGEELLARLRRSVDCRLVADVPLGAFLSGGVDSSGIVATMAGLIDRPAETFTMSFAEADFDEAPYAASVAQRYRTKHRVKEAAPEPIDALGRIVDIFDEPFADSSAIPTYHISSFARRHVTVALSGDGGDETFAGYRRYWWHCAEERVRSLIPGWLRQPAFAGLAALYPKLDWAPQVFRAKTAFHELSLDSLEGYKNNVSLLSQQLRSSLFSDNFRRELQGYSSTEVLRDALRGCDAEHPLLRAQYLDIKTYLPGDILVKVDRASMAHSLEVRVPLLDHDFVEWACHIPADLKIRGRERKWILKRALAEQLPEELLRRPKQGFSVPLSRWLRGPLREDAERSLMSDTLGDTGIFRRERVRRLLDQHLGGQRDHGAALWCLLVFARFAEQRL